ncbi:hypothetical protein IWQ56_005248, partial [Coemansia nantahalensis]
VETSAVLKELARFRSCDDQTMSCFYCREWAQWVYRKQISPQAAASGATATSSAGGGSTGGSSGGSNSNSNKKKKNRAQGGQPASHAGAGAAAASGEEALERERLERRRAARARFNAVSDVCHSLRSMVDEERDALAEAATVTAVAAAAATAAGAGGSRPASPTGSAGAGGALQAQGRAKDTDASGLIDGIVEQVTVWCEGYQFPLAEVYEDLTFDFPADAFPYDDNQDPLDPALLLPALQMSKAFISLPAPSFPLLGNITSELIATHTYPTCQHTKADHPTPSELETQRLIFNSQLQKWRGEYKRSFEREMEPVWQITQLLLKSAQRIETMRVRLFARGCRTNREQFLQTIRSRTQPFSEFWTRASEAYRTGRAAAAVSEGDEQSGPKTAAQLAEEVDALVHTHLDNVLEVSASWSRTFLESYYGVAREFARELETILGECITMCDRRAQGLKYPPPLTLQPQLAKARSAVACLLPQLEARVERIQQVVRERNSDIFSLAEDIRASWAEASGATVQTKLARAAHKDFRKRMRRIEHQQQVGVIGWAMRELEHLLTAPDVAAVVVDCLELLMTE